MINLFQKFVAVLTSIVAVLTFHGYPGPSISPSPSNSPAEESTSQVIELTPTSSPRIHKTVHTSRPTPDISGLVDQLNQLKQQIAAYTPEPTPTPQIIYIQPSPIITVSPTLTATPSPSPSPTATPTPAEIPGTLDIATTHTYGGYFVTVPAFDTEIGSFAIAASSLRTFGYNVNISAINLRLATSGGSFTPNSLSGIYLKIWHYDSLISATAKSSNHPSSTDSIIFPVNFGIPENRGDFIVKVFADIGYETPNISSGDSVNLEISASGTEQLGACRDVVAGQYVCPGVVVQSGWATGQTITAR